MPRLIRAENVNAGLSQFPKPQISLHHEPYETTVRQTLPYLMQKCVSRIDRADGRRLHAKGYKIVSLEECTGIKPCTSMRRL